MESLARLARLSKGMGCAIGQKLAPRANPREVVERPTQRLPDMQPGAGPDYGRSADTTAPQHCAELCSGQKKSQRPPKTTLEKEVRKH